MNTRRVLTVLVVVSLLTAGFIAYRFSQATQEIQEENIATTEENRWLVRKKQGLEINLQTLEEEKEEVEHAIKAYGKQLAGLSEKKHALASTLEKLEGQLSEAGKDIEALEKEKKELRDKVDSVQDSANNLRGKIKNLKERKQGLKKKIKEVR